jgi:hypothetical protein
MICIQGVINDSILRSTSGTRHVLQAFNLIAEDHIQTSPPSFQQRLLN